MADASVFMMRNYDGFDFVNVGAGKGVTIKELAEDIRKIVVYTGIDLSKPDGTPRKLLDVTKLEKAGWQAKIKLDDGIRSTYAWFINNESTFRQ